MTAKGSFFPRRTKQYVPSMQYAADVRKGGTGKVRIPALAAALATGILSAASIATAGSLTTFAATLTEAAMGKFGRNITVVASGAATSTVTVHGNDYLGQNVSEQFTLNGATPVVGKKAFKWINKIEYGATAATTINVGWGIALGLPYKLLSNQIELVSNAVPASAGALIVGVDTQTLTSADPRGTYTPHSTQVPDGVKYYDLQALFDESNLHGAAHFSAAV